MFQRPIPAILHFFVYAGFLIVNIELLEIVLDGLLGTHRMFASVLGSLYVPLINFFEFFGVAVFLACLVFVIRRNIIKLKRFHSEEMTSGPKSDANIILAFEMFLMFFLLNMNATDSAMIIKNGGEQAFFFSGFLVPLYQNASLDALHIAERFYWWAHILGIFCFANYVFYSKHLHIFLAFPSTFFANLEPKGKMENMPIVTNEVNIMLGLGTPSTDAAPVDRFGAKDVTDLTRKNLLDAFSCTECGRCTSSCPANITGKKLSPRAILMKTRDRAEEIIEHKRVNGEESMDDKSLLGSYISEEEIFACTTCNACTEACPINLDPLDVILKLRRYKAMEEAQGPHEWNGMYQNMETSFNPWKFPPSDRGNWTNLVG